MTETSNNTHFDLIIVGGGLAGASLACALLSHQQASLKIAIVEAYAIDTDAQPSYDDRTVALSYGSRTILDAIGQWEHLAASAEAIETIHISDRGHFGVTRLTSEQEGVEALGYVVENRVIGQQLYRTLDASDQVTLLCPARLKTLHAGKDEVTVEVESDDQCRQYTSSLLVAADGNHSQVLQLLNIGSNRQDYGQTALITNVTSSQKHDNIAYERFTETGPLAFLPMSGNRCSVVWTLSPQQAEFLYALDDETFLSHLQQAFGFRLGQLKKSGRRQIYPLFLQAASQMTCERVAIIGNAAHSVHPVAGQGFNLALRDVALLSELVIDASTHASDIGDEVMLSSYASLRERDVQRVYRFTDALVKTFSNAISPLAHMRSLGLMLVDLSPWLKHQLATQSMGLNNKNLRQSRLIRGARL